MIRAEKHEVESIAASCATGLERAWAENDLLRQQLADQPEGVSHARLYMSILTACGIGVWLGLMVGKLA